VGDENGAHKVTLRFFVLVPSAQNPVTPFLFFFFISLKPKVE